MKRTRNDSIDSLSSFLYGRLFLHTLPPPPSPASSTDCSDSSPSSRWYSNPSRRVWELEDSQSHACAPNRGVPSCSSTETSSEYYQCYRMSLHSKRHASYQTIRKRIFCTQTSAFYSIYYTNHSWFLFPYPEYSWEYNEENLEYLSRFGRKESVQWSPPW